MSDIKRIGISTCGGDCPGLNPVIRAVVTSAILNHGWEVVGIEDSTCGLIDLNYRGPNGNMDLTLSKVSDLISKGGTILGSSNKSHPFKYVKEREDGTLYEDDVSDLVVENFKKLKLDCLVMVGGDGSMEIGNKLYQKGIPIVGVPKTIDNDLIATDFTFGFNTAVQTITEACDKIRDTALSHDRVLIVEVMGRNAGWLALHSGISSAADVILIPEIPYSADSILKKIHRRHQRHEFSSIIVVSEGAKTKDGEESFLGERKPGEMIRYKGAAAKLEALLNVYNIKTNSHYIRGLEIRTSVLGYIQRGGSPSNYDRILGTRFGVKAVELIAEKKFGYMASLSGQEVVAVPLNKATEGQKLVNPNGELVRVAKTMGICFGDE